MDGVGPGGSDGAGAEPPLTVEALADLQAGLLDNDKAARMRKQVRADPHARQTMDALNRVRRDIAKLGTDAASAPDVAPEVVDGIAATLGAQRLDRSRGGAVLPVRPGGALCPPSAPSVSPVRRGWPSPAPVWPRPPSRPGWEPPP